MPPRTLLITTNLALDSLRAETGSMIASATEPPITGVTTSIRCVTGPDVDLDTAASRRYALIVHQQRFHYRLAHSTKFRPARTAVDTQFRRKIVPDESLDCGLIQRS